MPKNRVPVSTRTLHVFRFPIPSPSPFIRLAPARASLSAVGSPCRRTLPGGQRSWTIQLEIYPW